MKKAFTENSSFGTITANAENTEQGTQNKISEQTILETGFSLSSNFNPEKYEWFINGKKLSWTEKEGNRFSPEELENISKPGTNSLVCIFGPISGTELSENGNENVYYAAKTDFILSDEIPDSKEKDEPKQDKPTQDRTEANYTVEHYLQKLSDDKTSAADDYEIPHDATEIKTGISGEETTAQAASFNGFTAKPITQTTVKQDGSTVVKIYYDRNEISLTFDLNGGTGTERLSGKYGTNLPSFAEPTKTDHTFRNWTPALPTSFPSEDTEYKATWKIVFNQNDIGKIYLADGTLVSADIYSAVDKTNPPVAVVAHIEDGNAIGIGLHTSQSLAWTPKTSIGYSTSFPNTVCTPNILTAGAADSATFEGDTDGSDNWEAICSVEKTDTQDAEKNYPAFFWANTYGKTYSLYLGGTEDNWYLPSVAELCYVYRNRNSINTTLSAINTLASDYSEKSLGTGYFWTSSQRVSTEGVRGVCSVSFGDGTISTSRQPKYGVLVVRKL